jgi:hypothetical protein
MAINEREENAYTLAVQAGLWGYPLAQIPRSTSGVKHYLGFIAATCLA